MEQIRFCKIEELPILQKFLNDYWRKNHILSQHKDLLQFQHLNDTQINYVVAYDEETNNFTSVLGFIPTFQYHNHHFLNDKVNIWLAIWCRAPHATKGIGMKLYEFLIDFYKPFSVAAIGINSKIKETYKSMGYSTGKLNHYYLLKKPVKPVSFSPNSSVKPDIYLKTQEIESFNEFQFQSEKRPISVPFKTVEYFKTRYKNHPIYNYEYYGIYENDDNVLIDVIVVRENWMNKNGKHSCCLRIVDSYNHFMGVPDISAQLNELLILKNAEYIDCLNYGLGSGVFERMGFKKRIGDEVIIPNYFEPFEEKNVDIEFAYKLFKPVPQEYYLNYKRPIYKDEDYYVIFKGDSDQDRPNLLTSNMI